jgi:hypothetical protein
MSNLEQFFLLTFGTTMGGSRTLRVNHVNPGVTDSTMRTAMTNIVASGTLHGARGVAVIPRRAALVGRTVTALDLASVI